MLERVRQERTKAMHAAAYRTNGAFALAVAILGLLAGRGRSPRARGERAQRGPRRGVARSGARALDGRDPGPAPDHGARLARSGRVLTARDGTIPAALFVWLVEQPFDTLLGLLTDLTCDRIGDWNEGRMHAGHAVTGLTAAFAGFLEIRPSGGWALEREHLETCSRETVARWNEGEGLHVRPSETRKELIARLLEIKPKLLERGWCPPELSFDPAQAKSSQAAPAPEARVVSEQLSAPDAPEVDEDDWSEAEDWDDAA